MFVIVCLQYRGTIIIYFILFNVIFDNINVCVFWFQFKIAHLQICWKICLLNWYFKKKIQMLLYLIILQFNFSKPHLMLHFEYESLK